MNIKRLFILTCTVLLGLTLVSIWMFLLTTPPKTAHAAGPWYVAPGGSDGDSCLSTTAPCATINGAIGKATGGDTIYVAIGTYTSTDEEVVVINKDITLSGGWDSNFINQGGTSTIDGEEERRGIYIEEGITSIIERFTIQNGHDDGERDGGCGINTEGTLTLTYSAVINNKSDTNGGGIRVGDTGVLYMESSIVSGNFGGAGGGIIVWGFANISRSWVVGNEAGEEGGGIASFSSTIYIENSIIAGNLSQIDFGGQSSGGGINFLGTAGGDGGPYYIVNSHIVGNQARYGAAIAASDYYEVMQVEITNTLIISNTGITGIGSPYTDTVYTDEVFLLNFCDTYGNSRDGKSGVTITRNNCLGTPPEDGLDPMMAGGALPSGVGPDYADEWLSYDYRLLPGSPAIDAGTPVDAPATDIAGNPRDAKPDMGAYEWVYRILLPLVAK